jgi:hypothetical protein
MITGVRVVERNDQVAGTKGSDVRTNGECVGTRYGVIYIGSEGNEGKSSEFRSRSSGTGLGEWDLTLAQHHSQPYSTTTTTTTSVLEPFKTLVLLLALQSIRTCCIRDSKDIKQCCTTPEIIQYLYFGRNLCNN